MKRNNYLIKIFLLLGVAFFMGCNSNELEDKFKENPASGWVDFNVSVAAATLSPTATELTIPVSLNAPVNATDLEVSFALESVSGGSPTDVVTSAARSFTIPSAELDSEIVLSIGDLVPFIANGVTVEFDVVLTATDRSTVSAGLSDDSQITRYRVSTPCPINVIDGTEYTGNSVYQPAGANFLAQEGFTATITAVPGMDLTYDIDTVWGPNYVAVVCGNCVAPGDYPGPVRISIDPATFEVTVIDGGEPSGQGYQFDIDYGITGISGTYDTCNDSFTLEVFDADLFGEPVGITLLSE